MWVEATLECALSSGHGRVAPGRRSAEFAGKLAGRQALVSRRLAGTGNPHRLRLRAARRFRPLGGRAAIGGRLAGPFLGAGPSDDRHGH